MRNPNGYGSVVNLGKNRRKPYAVRISTGVKKNAAGKVIPTYKYLDYFEKKSDALSHLGIYNSGIVPLPAKDMAISDIPTFKQVYEEYIEYARGRKRQVSEDSYYGYNSGFLKLKELHDMKFPNITFEMLQTEIDKCSGMSIGTMTHIRVILRKMYQYAIKKRYITADQDVTRFCDFEVDEPTRKTNAHTVFTPDELKTLWENSHDYNTGTFLILIYTGMRITELVTLTQDKVNMNEHYIQHGIKTDAGRDRIIPIHDAIYPIVQERMNGGEYLVEYKCKKRGRHSFYYNVLDKTMEKYQMKHLSHDGRHTLATLMKLNNVDDLARKLILGHAVKDVTDGIYTHYTPEKLLEEINKVPVEFVYRAYITDKNGRKRKIKNAQK